MIKISTIISLKPCHVFRKTAGSIQISNTYCNTRHSCDIGRMQASEPLTVTTGACGSLNWSLGAIPFSFCPGVAPAWTWLRQSFYKATIVITGEVSHGWKNKDLWEVRVTLYQQSSGGSQRSWYLDVKKDPKMLEEMLKFSKGKRLVPVIVEGQNVTLGYGGTWDVWSHDRVGLTFI